MGIKALTTTSYDGADMGCRTCSHSIKHGQPVTTIEVAPGFTMLVHEECTERTMKRLGIATFAKPIFVDRDGHEEFRPTDIYESHAHEEI